VTWHDQRRPLIPVLACKTGKTRRGLAGGASSDDQVSPVFMRRGETERELKREEKILLSSSPYSPFISLHAKCPFYPCQAHCPMGTSDIFSDLI